jgi:hypothetical protein
MELHPPKREGLAASGRNPLSLGSGRISSGFSAREVGQHSNLGRIPIFLARSQPTIGTLITKFADIGRTDASRRQQFSAFSPARTSGRRRTAACVSASTTVTQTNAARSGSASAVCGSAFSASGTRFLPKQYKNNLNRTGAWQSNHWTKISRTCRDLQDPD